jgi:hypothetical protein
LRVFLNCYRTIAAGVNPTHLVTSPQQGKQHQGKTDSPGKPPNRPFAGAFVANKEKE